MGLLTDPSAGQGKLSKCLIKFNVSLCILLYIGGISWFCSLAYPTMNQETYISENALLPGLVKSEFREDAAARQYYEELLDEMEKYKDALPYPWLQAKFRQIGLDTYTHNFTLNVPLGKPQKWRGKNVYGILRAPRASSTESLVLSVPYRPPSSIHPTTAPSIAIMLAFARFANRENYWAKDIIFLITEHEQLGAQAWLEAYHGVHCGDEGALDHGDLQGRAGSIQAAINLELHDINIAQIDVKIEGLNGQLPNLDLFNLVSKISIKEGIAHTFQGRVSKSFKTPLKKWAYSFKTLLRMVCTQATGIPNGNHGLFHRFGIEALTIEGFPTTSVRGVTRASFLIMGRILEGVFRSLNNLLERFHQSYFFYLLPSSDRFISIGLYIPSVCLLVAALFIRACAKWCKIQITPSVKDEEDTDRESEAVTTTDEQQIESEEDESEQEEEQQLEQIEVKMREEIEKARASEDSDGINIIEISAVFVVAHFLGVLVLNCPQFVTKLGSAYDVRTENSVLLGLSAVSLAVLAVPAFVPFRRCERSLNVLCIVSLLEFGTSLICIAMNNFSLALFCSAVYVPLALFISPTTCRVYSWMQRGVWFLAHPLIVLVLTVGVYTFVMFPNESLLENIARGDSALKQSVVFAIVDSMIYGNWLFSVLCGILFPTWICFWIIACGSPRRIEQSCKTDLDKKNE